MNFEHVRVAQSLQIIEVSYLIVKRQKTVPNVASNVVQGPKNNIADTEAYRNRKFKFSIQKCNFCMKGFELSIHCKISLQCWGFKTKMLRYLVGIQTIMDAG